MSDTPLGRFCWFELLTNDPEASLPFYEAVVGWGNTVHEPSGQPYTVWVNGETPIGGVMQLPPEAVANGAPPHWLAYVSTPDLDDTIDRATGMGATILANLDIPAVGQMAVIQDPQGAVMCAYQPSDATPGHDGEPRNGEVSWMELATDGWEGAWDFYSKLFGWEQTDHMDMGDMGRYQMFGRGAHPIGGMFDRPPQVPVPCWWCYVRVPDIAAAVESARTAGGQIMTEPMEVPGGDLIAHIIDPQGAAFAVHEKKSG